MDGRPIQTENVGTRSGNALYQRMLEEKEKLAKEIMQAEREARLRLCPGCDTIGYIPDDDYLCESCRLGL